LNSCSLLRLRALLVTAAVSLPLLGGCASTGDPRDPLEPLNRAVYQFNEGFDKVIAKPVAEFYRDVVPPVVRTGIGNFFSNLNDVIVALNNLLQGKVPEAINDFGRVLVNTTLGVLGVMDPATELGVEKHNEDFGQTLGYWGLGDGPYIVLPLLGPSNLRDTVGWVGDIYSWPVTYLSPNSHRNVLIGLRFTDARADLLEATRLLETAALDPYEFVRDAYLQRRRYLVHDGNPPEEVEPNETPKPEKPRPTSRNTLTPRIQLPDSAFEAGDTWQPALEKPESRSLAVDQLAPAAEAPPTTTGKTLRVWLPFSRN
jgi:phospholipid-binding lipoprotein MlaA